MKNLLWLELSKYEQGQMTEEQEIKLFQYLVKTGIAWQLQGSYGRRAAMLIEAGVVQPANDGQVEES